ncbi:hypothetical protein ZWY2020_025476 [Hordeum vulgare]|nr:hypothetical protein ZWY2020_025476 [Hordeum vulgare]
MGITSQGRSHGGRREASCRGGGSSCNAGQVIPTRLEQESGFYFNTKYFEEKVHAGEWDEVERYLSGFTKVDDNRYSMKMIRKQKYLEALDRHDRAKAVDILVKDLKVFSTFTHPRLYAVHQVPHGKGCQGRPANHLVSIGFHHSASIVAHDCSWEQHHRMAQPRLDRRPHRRINNQA